MATIAEALALAQSHEAAGQTDSAAAVYEAVLRADPRQVDALLALARFAHRAGRLPQTVAYLVRLTEAAPDDYSHYNNLGLILQQMGRLDEAVRALQRAVELAPRQPAVHANLGVLRATSGQIDAATACFQQAIQIDPRCVAAHANLGKLLHRTRQLGPAIEHLRAALELQPGTCDAYCDLGQALRDEERFDEAMACYQRGTARFPDNLELHLRLGHIATDQGDREAALAAFGRANVLSPSLRTRYQMASLLPVIYQSCDEIRQERARLLAELERMVDSGQRINPCAEPIQPPFFLVYQALEDRPVHEMLARLLAAPPDVPRPSPPRTRDGRIRVGFVSRLLRFHTVGMMWMGNLAEIDRQQFEIGMFTGDPVTDILGQWLHAKADCHMSLPDRLPDAAKLIAESGFDVLVYPDVGMDPIMYSLASLRLAPVQCVSWGHPVTTGLSTIDYYVSSRLVERDDAQSDYTERLVLMETLGFQLFRSKSQATKTRADFGLPDDRRLYGCLQNLFKMHPDNDPLWAGILRSDPQAEVILVSGMSRSWDAQLRARFARTMPDVAERIRFLPRLGYSDYLAVTRLMDVLLDPYHFTGGRTSWEALGAGLPIITLPGRFLRERMTYGMYRGLGVLDCVAQTPDEFVSKAVHVAGDPEYRRHLSQRLLDAGGDFFESTAAVREWEAFFRRVVGR